MNNHTNNPDPQNRQISPPKRRLPSWIRSTYGGEPRREEVRGLLRKFHLNTVCESARCPNLGECWGRGTATFMIMGENCTRNCLFCAVENRNPTPIDKDEGDRISEAALSLGLRYIVLTSVTRDDLADGGAAHFARVINTLRRKTPNAGIEVLTPDFQGDEKSLRKVLQAGPDVFNHNIETCRRLTGKLRDPQASYERSLAVLRRAAEIKKAGTIVKSGFMLGLGESEEDVRELLRDLSDAGVTRLTIGQYLQPHRQCAEVVEFITPEKFTWWKQTAEEEYGFAYVESAPLARSSYMADQV